MSEKKRKESLSEIEKFQKKKHELEMELENIEFNIKISNLKNLKELFIAP